MKNQWLSRTTIRATLVALSAAIVVSSASADPAKAQPPGVFESAEYPVDISDVQDFTEVLSLYNAEISCKAPPLSGSLGSSSEFLTLNTTEDGICPGRGPIEMNGCQFTFEPGYKSEAGTEFNGTLGIGPPGCGPIVAKSYIFGCDVAIDPHLGFTSSVQYTNAEEPVLDPETEEPLYNESDIEVEASLWGLQYTQYMGTGCSPGLHGGGVWKAHWVLDADNEDEEPVPLRVVEPQYDDSIPHTIVTAGPRGSVWQQGPDTPVSFSFVAVDKEPETPTFFCELDESGFSPCTSPKVFPLLPEGEHTFRVMAKDEEGNEDPTPAERTFYVKDPPETTITTPTPSYTAGETWPIEFESDEENVTFKCAFDESGTPSKPCSSPFTPPEELGPGWHSFRVFATDEAGNVDWYPASWYFKTAIYPSAPSTSKLTSPEEGHKSSSHLTLRSEWGSPPSGGGVKAVSYQLKHPSWGAFKPIPSEYLLDAEDKEPGWALPVSSNPGTSPPLVFDVAAYAEDEEWSSVVEGLELRAVFNGGENAAGTSEPVSVTYSRIADGSADARLSTTPKWAITSLSEPSGAKSSKFLDVSCRGSHDCVAVGFYTNSSGTVLALTEEWNGSTWSVQATPAPSGATESKLEAVSCTSTATCVAVGHYKASSGAILPLAQRWDGSEWTLQSAPSPEGATDTRLSGVSCTSAGICTAVGHSADGSGDVDTLAQRWNGVEWQIQSTPNVSGAQTNYLHDVSCVSSTDCWAVGKPAGLVARWDGTEWSLASMSDPPATLHDVSCASGSWCVAAGEGRVLRHRDGSEWTPKTAPSPPAGSGGSLTGASCPSPSLCIAVGAYTDPTPTSHTAPFAARWKGAKWTIKTPSDPIAMSEVAAGSLDAVSCGAVNSCVAVGATTDGTETPRVLAEAYEPEPKGDQVLPELTIGGAPFDGGNFLGAHPEIEVQASDEGSGVTSLQLLLDGEDLDSLTKSCPSGGCGLNHTFKPDLSARKAGNHTLEVVATDADGNSISRSAAFVLDPSGPAIKLGGPLLDSADGPLGVQTAQLDITITEARSEKATGMTEIRVLVDGEPATDYTPTCSPDCSEPVITSFTFDKEDWGPGPHDVEVQADDVIGNTSESVLAVDVPDGPGVVLSGTLYQRRGKTIGAQAHKLTVQASQTNGSSVAPRPGVKSIEVRVDGTPETSPPTQTCSAGNCSMSREWSFVPTMYTAGAHTVEVLVSDQLGNTTKRTFEVTINTSDACADSAEIPSESCPPLTGEVDHAWIYTANPASGGALVAEEWVELGTHNARRQDAEGILTTRGTVSCTSNESGKCGEVRSAPTSPDQTSHNYVVTTGLSVSDPDLDRVADLRHPGELELGAPVESGDLVDALKSWQDPPPNHGSTFNVYEIEEEEEETGTVTIERWWLDNQTGLPLRHTIVMDDSATGGAITKSHYFFTFDQKLIKASELAASFFLLAEPKPVDEVTEQTAEEGSVAANPEGE